MHNNGIGHSREQIVQQVKDNDPSIHDYRSYVPIGKAAEKLTQWKNRGAEIFYLTSRRKHEEINDVASHSIRKHKRTTKPWKIPYRNV
ncbi:MAG: hypothetical protein JW881_14750 [Spirochaetales bacterium]|nr:hypothetical protein [Spirochaetales bacterium]